jgi:hypothetical protein
VNAGIKIFRGESKYFLRFGVIYIEAPVLLLGTKRGEEDAPNIE